MLHCMSERVYCIHAGVVCTGFGWHLVRCGSEIKIKIDSLSNYYGEEGGARRW